MKKGVFTSEFTLYMEYRDSVLLSESSHWRVVDSLVRRLFSLLYANVCFREDASLQISNTVRTVILNHKELGFVMNFRTHKL